MYYAYVTFLFLGLAMFVFLGAVVFHGMAIQKQTFNLNSNGKLIFSLPFVFLLLAFVFRIGA